MSKVEKLLKRLEEADQGLSFDELKKILEGIGYIGTFPGGGSSHCTFRKKGRRPITIPKHIPIGIVYIKAVRDLVREEIQDE